MENNLSDFKFCHLLYSSGRTVDSVLEESIALLTNITRQEDKKGSYGNGISSNNVSFFNCGPQTGSWNLSLLDLCSSKDGLTLLILCFTVARENKLNSISLLLIVLSEKS